LKLLIAIHLPRADQLTLIAVRLQAKKPAQTRRLKPLKPLERAKKLVLKLKMKLQRQMNLLMVSKPLQKMINLLIQQVLLNLDPQVKVLPHPLKEILLPIPEAAQIRQLLAVQILVVMEMLQVAILLTEPLKALIKLEVQRVAALQQLIQTRCSTIRRTIIFQKLFIQMVLIMLELQAMHICSYPRDYKHPMTLV
jgi:hypothetical protein